MPFVSISSGNNKIAAANEHALKVSADLRAERQKKLEEREKLKVQLRAINAECVEISQRITKVEIEAFNNFLSE